MNIAERIVMTLLAILGVIVIISIALVTERAISEKKRCALSNGTYSGEICFKNELLIKIK